MEMMHLKKKNDQLSLASKIFTKLMRNTAVDDNGNLVVQKPLLWLAAFEIKKFWLAKAVDVVSGKSR